MRVLLPWLAIAVALSACSSINLDEAKKLGAKGQQAATAFQDETKAVQHQSANAVDYLILIREINGIPHAIGEEERAQYDKLNELLAARLKVYRALGTLYGSFGELAAFDAAAATQKAADDFIGTANNFIALVDKLGTASPVKPISEGAQAITSKVFTVIGEEAQKRRVEEASRVTAAALRKVVQAVEAEQVFAVSLRKGLARQRINLAMSLTAADLASLKGVVVDVANDVGTVPFDDIDSRLAANPTAKTAFLNLVQHRAERQVEAVDESYQAQVNLLQSLIAEHEKLEAGEPVSIDQILKWIGELEQLAQAVSKL